MHNTGHPEVDPYTCPQEKARADADVMAHVAMGQAMQAEAQGPVTPLSTRMRVHKVSSHHLPSQQALRCRCRCQCSSPHSGSDAGLCCEANGIPSLHPVLLCFSTSLCPVSIAVMEAQLPQAEQRRARRESEASRQRADSDVVATKQVMAHGQGLCLHRGAHIHRPAQRGTHPQAHSCPPHLFMSCRKQRFSSVGTGLL